MPQGRARAGTVTVAPAASAGQARRRPRPRSRRPCPLLKPRCSLSTVASLASPVRGEAARMSSPWSWNITAARARVPSLPYLPCHRDWRRLAQAPAMRVEHRVRLQRHRHQCPPHGSRVTTQEIEPVTTPSNPPPAFGQAVGEAERALTALLRQILDDDGGARRETWIAIQVLVSHGGVMGGISSPPRWPERSRPPIRAPRRASVERHRRGAPGPGRADGRRRGPPWASARRCPTRHERGAAGIRPGRDRDDDPRASRGHGTGPSPPVTPSSSARDLGRAVAGAPVAAT